MYVNFKTYSNNTDFAIFILQQIKNNHVKSISVNTNNPENPDIRRTPFPIPPG